MMSEDELQPLGVVEARGAEAAAREVQPNSVLQLVRATMNAPIAPGTPNRGPNPRRVQQSAQLDSHPGRASRLPETQSEFEPEPQPKPMMDSVAPAATLAAADHRAEGTQRRAKKRPQEVVTKGGHELVHFNGASSPSMVPAGSRRESLSAVLDGNDDEFSTREGLAQRSVSLSLCLSVSLSLCL